MRYKSSQNGRSMVEMLGYLMIMMSVIIAISKIASSAFDNHRYSTATLQLTELATSMVKAAALDVDYTDVIADVNGDNKMNIIPSSFRKVGSKIYHVFGGEVKVEKSGYKICPGVLKTDGTCPVDLVEREDQFKITFEGLSQKQCIELAMKNWDKNQYTDLYAMEINNGENIYSWYWEAYGDDEGKDTLESIEAGNCSGTTCVFPIKRVKLTGTGAEGSTPQCGESGNSISWVFN